MTELGYLACPFNHPDPEVMEQRFRIVTRVAGQLIAKGIYVFSPITHNVPILRHAGVAAGWKEWQNFDLAVLERCNRLYVLKLEGWERSTGVLAEIEFAKRRGIPTEYLEAPST